MAEVEFFFDYSCPWTYLAFTRLMETATRTGSRIIWKPIVVAWVLDATNPEVAESRVDANPRKARYQAKDLDDWATFCNVVIKRPAGWPADSEPAMRGAVVANDAGCIVPYSRGVFGGYFESGDDITEPAVLRRIAEEAGMDGADFEAQLGTDGTLNALRTNVDALIERGGFGSPTMFVGDAMFFGNDRMPLVEFALGQASGRRFVVPGDHSA